SMTASPLQPITADDAAADAGAAGAEMAGGGVATRTLLSLGPRELITAGFIENRGMVLIAGVIALLEQAGLSERLVERLIASDSAIIAATIGRWNVTDVPVVRGALLLLAAALT